MACGVVLMGALISAGCAVGQPPGNGRCQYLREASTGSQYWLYLPEGYDDSPPPGEARPKRPLVMTFHGMKPFDDANRQIREWQQEADRYGFIVCAPILQSPYVTSPLPLTNPNDSRLKRDERATIAIMNELYRTVDVDPNHVLATSWSYGGYVAHYMANRYPERFSCIVAKQSNFNEELLDPAMVPRYQDHKVAIFYTENDFAICRRESRRAVEWYARNGFDLTHAIFEKKGHERTPGVAAELFAQTCGIEAKSPPIELARMQVITLPHPVTTQEDPTEPAAHAGEFAPSRPRASGERHGVVGQPVEVASAQSPFVIVPGSGPATHPGSTARDTDTPENNDDEQDAIKVHTIRPESIPVGGAVRIRVSSTIGVAPLVISYSAVVPKHLQRKASLLWTDNGVPISNGVNGQKVFNEPGHHKLEVLVTAPNGTEYRSSRIINVIERSWSGNHN